MQFCGSWSVVNLCEKVRVALKGVDWLAPLDKSLHVFWVFCQLIECSTINNFFVVFWGKSGCKD